MAFTKVEDWSETAASNTEINGMPLSDSTQIDALDNIEREHMAQIAKWLGDDTVASAATADLGAVPGRYINITGTTTITAFGTIKAGTIKYVKFAGILTLTHNGTSLILPGAANITTAAGDAAIFVSEGSGNWRCLAYQRAVNNLGGWETLSAVSGTATSALTKGSLSAYKRLRISGTVKPASDGQSIILQTSTDDGANYAESSGDYAVQFTRSQGATVNGNGNVTNLGAYVAATSVGSDTNERVGFTMEMQDFNASEYCLMTCIATVFGTDGVIWHETSSSVRRSTTARNALRIIAASGNITGSILIQGSRT